METKNIRLLHFVKSLEMGGMEKSTILYSNLISKKIKFIGVFAHKGFYDDYDFIEPKVRRYFPKNNIWSKFFFIPNLIDIFKILHANRITHFHYHHRIFIPFVLIIKVFFPNILIIYSHQNVFNDQINNFILADKIIALTKATKDDLPKWLKKKVTIIPHGIILPLNKISSKKQPTNFGYVGRFVDWKGVIPLIHEFKKLNKNISGSQLFLVGSGVLKEDIKKVIIKLSLDENVTVLEPQVNLAKVYEMIDVLVLPSKTLEGFGIVLVEAMSYGIPVIVYDTPTYQDTVINTYNGIIAKDSLTEAMQNIITVDGLYSSLSSNAVQYSRKYDINMIVDRYLEEIYLI